MASVDSGGVRVHFEVVGSGPPVLLVHGAFASLRWWRRAGHVDALRRDHRLVLMDLRGHGESDRPHEPSNYGLVRDAEDAAAVLDAAGVESATVCGWSWGGTTGLVLAALQPGRVRGILAIGASGHHGRFSDVAADFSLFPEAQDRLATGGLAWLADEMSRAAGLDWPADELLRNDLAALRAWQQGQVAAPPLGRRLGDLTQPVRFLAGEEEVPLLSFPPVMTPPHGTLRVLPGENHVTTFLSVPVVAEELRRLTQA